MPVIAIFSGLFCAAEKVATRVAARLDYELLGKEVLTEAAGMLGVSEARLERFLVGQESFLGNLTHDQEKSLIYTKAALARRLDTDHLVYLGLATHLIPNRISHVLKVCLVADHAFRIAQAAETKGLSEKEATKQIERQDPNLARWTQELHRRGPWDAALYDIKIPMQTTSVEAATELITESAHRDALKLSDQSLQAALDFRLATRVNVTLLEQGHYYCDVTADHRRITILVNKEVLRLDALERELTTITRTVEGVADVRIKAGPKFNKPNILHRFDFQVPPRVLLVDDEREYIMTLSERLQMRDFMSQVAYSGEEALACIADNEPDVMVLDLRMPGLDGLEVLRQVKQSHPRVEVIILTGHGTDKDEQIALELGAFAYLQKPVSIDRLAKAMQAASAKAKVAQTDEAADSAKPLPDSDTVS